MALSLNAVGFSQSQYSLWKDIQSKFFRGKYADYFFLSFLLQGFQYFQ